MGGVKQSRVHGVDAASRVNDHRGLQRCLNHIGGKAVAAGEIEPATGAVPGVPPGEGRGQGRHRVDQQQPRAGRRHRECRRRIARSPRPIKQHPVKPLEKTGVDQMVEMAINICITKPRVRVR